MNKLPKFLVALVITALAMVPVTSRAEPVRPVQRDACSQCVANPNNCFACCICDGHNTPLGCADIC